MSIIDIDHLDMIFGPRPDEALAHLDCGLNRSSIKQKTGHVVGVHDATLAIEEGEIFVLMGLSGSGKSTLLRAINGLLPISRGTIHLNIPGHQSYALARADEAAWREIRTKHIAMVFQNFALLPWKNVLENVAFGLELAGVNKSERLKRAHGCLEAVDLVPWAKHLPQELSGGMLQRVGLARALATDASILLMDEPFSALDPLIKNHLQQELLRLQRSLKKTIVFVTHDLDEALKIGNHIAIMQEGSIIQVGTPEAIITQPKTPYVKQFVAHVDQTQLLRARAIMTALGDLKIGPNGTVALDDSGNFHCVLDGEGRPRRSVCRTREGRIVPWTFFQSGSLNENDLVLGSEHLLMRDVIKTMGITRRPLVIQDREGKMVGAISSDGLLTALSG